MIFYTNNITYIISYCVRYQLVFLTDFINKYFGPGSAIIVEGRISIDPGQEKEDGTHYPNRIYVLVENQEFAPQNRGKAKEDNGLPQVKSAAKPITAKTASFMPF